MRRESHGSHGAALQRRFRRLSPFPGHFETALQRDFASIARAHAPTMHPRALGGSEDTTFCSTLPPERAVAASGLLRSGNRIEPVFAALQAPGSGPDEADWNAQRDFGEETGLRCSLGAALSS